MPLIFLLLILLPSLGFAASITGVSGTPADGNSLTISGSGFGSGPTVLVFDDFEDGTSGVRMDGTATVGTWTGSGGIGSRDYPKVTNVESASGSLAINAIEGDTWGAWDQFYKNTSDFTEVFVSYYAWVPVGYYYPYATATEDFGSGSSFKALWLTYNGSTTEDDLIAITKGSGWNFSVSGNDWASSITPVYLGQEWWSWTQPNRLTTWIKAGSPASAATGTVYTQLIGASRSDQTTTSKQIFDTDGTANLAWNRIVIPGNFEIKSGYADAMLYDDIYIATGANAAARVELGNAADYATCTKLAIATVDSWSDTSISVTVREGLFDATDSAYLYVVTADNTATVYSTPLFFDEAAPETAPTVTITGPTSNSLYSTNESSLSLSGTASDDGSVSSVAWSCPTCSVTSGSATGTVSWSASLTLAEGSNTITVTATDNSAETGQDTLTATYTAPVGGGGTPIKAGTTPVKTGVTPL